MGLGEVFKLFATLGIDATEFDRALSQAESKLNATAQAFGGAGRTLSTAITAPIVGLGVGAIKAGADFEMAMNQVAAVSGATGEEFEQLRDLALELGATTQFSASQAAEAMNFMAMAGMSAQEIIGAMPDALKLAAAAQLDMGRTADIVTNILAGYGMGIDELGHAVDVLVQGFTSANTDLSMLAEAMKYAGPVANAAGVDFEEAAAALGLMGNAGIQASMAGTSLRGAITRMLNPTEKVQNIMQAAGLSFTDAEGRLLPLAEIIAQLEPHAENAGMFMEIFGQRAGPAMAALVSQGSDALRELTAQLENSGGRADEVAAVQMQGFHGAMRLFKSAVEALMISIADSGLLEWLTGMVTGLAKLIQRLSDTNPFLLRMATVLGALVASVGPALWMVGSFAGAVKNLLPLLRMVPGLLTGIRTALGLLTGPVGWIITAIGLIATAWATDFLGIRTTVTENWDKVVAVFQGAWERVKSIGQGIVDGFRSAWDTVSGVFTGARDTMQRNLDWVMDDVRIFGMGVKDLIAGDWRGAWVHAAELVDNFTTTIEDTWPGFAWWIRDRFKDLTDVVHSAGTAIEAVFRGDWDAALTAGREMLTNWWQGLDNLLGGMPGRLIEHGKTAIAGLVDGFRERFPGVVTFTEDLLDNMRVTGMALGDLARGDWRGALTHVEQLFDWFTTSIEDTFPGFTNWLRDRFNDIVGFARTGGETLEALFRGRWSDAFQGLKDLAGQWWDGLNSLLGGIPRRILEWGVEVATAFRDWWDRSWEFLSGLPSRMLEFGKNLITGLIDGVKSMVTGAVEAVKGVGENVINGFKSLLGIESPSKVFYGFGVDIGEGLAQGIESTEGRVMEATAKLAEGVTSTFGSRTVGTVDTGAWVRAITDGLEGRDAVIALERALRELESQRAATFRHRFAGTAGRIARDLIDFKASVLEEELQRLREEIRRLRVQQARDTEVQTRRFSMAVGTFAQGVQGLQLARQRY